MSIQWSAPAWLWPLLPVVAAGAILWTVSVYRDTRPAAPGRLRRALTVLRGAVFTLLVLAVAAPVVSRLGSDREPATVMVVAEDSASMAIADGPGDAPRWSRAARVAALVDSLAGTADHRVRVVHLMGNGLDDLRAWPDGAAPDAHGTDLNRLADQVRRQGAGRPVRAVVLVSDGQETRSSTAAPWGAAAPRAVVVGVGDPVGPADRLIRDVRYPETVHRGDEVEVSLLVDHRHAGNDAPADLRVTIEGPDGMLADTLLTSVGGAVPVTLAFPAREEGLLVARLSVSPLDNERFLANNTVSLAVDVQRDRAHVLLLAARPGWDVRFLAQAAAAEPRLALTVVHPGAGGMVRADSLTAWTPPRGAAWAGWDAVVVAGDPTGLPGLDLAGLAEAVGSGRGLLVVAGGPQAPSAVPAALADLLPVTKATGAAWRPGPWRPVVAADGARHPVLAGVAAMGTAWPPLAALDAVSIRAGATTLLEAEGPRTGARGAVMPLLVAGRAGEGRVAWYGGEDLWSLAFAEIAGTGATEGEGAGRRLLRNLLVWLAAGDRESGLVFTGRQAVHPEGEPVRLSARWRDMRGAPVTGRQAQVLVRRADADSSLVPPATHALRPAGDGQWEATVPPLPPGRYEARLRGGGEPPVLGAALAFVVTGQSVEAGQVRRDQRRLDLWAHGLGTEAVDGDAADLGARLAARFAGLDWSPLEVPRRARLDLWSGWPFLGLVVVLLGCEWFLRRRHGML